MSEGKFDPHRRLCPDGACIGVIGSDGRCHVCGRVAGGGGSTAAPAAPEGFAPADDDDEVEDRDQNEGNDEPVAAAAAGAFDPKRRLCPDGDCLGVIGSGGVCNVCGKKAD